MHQESNREGFITSSSLFYLLGNFVGYYMKKIIDAVKFHKPEIVVLMLGTVYLLWYAWTGLGIPCVFRKVTGFRCPGCGVTHMVLHMVKLDFRAAYHDNPLIFMSIPFLLFEIILEEYRKYRRSRMPVWNNVLLFTYLFIIIVFGIYRNIYGF